MIRSGFWADQPSSAFHDLPADTVPVLPLGAIEQHGPHLPLSVDRDLAETVAARTLSHITTDQTVLILPTLAMTKSGEHDRFPGTLSLSADSLLAVLRDIGASVARAGLERLVLLNAHGGNTAVLEIVARDLRMRHEMIVAHASWFGFADYGALFDAEALRHDIHAGETETSAMLAAHPDKVQMDKALNFIPKMTDWEGQFPTIGLTGQPARPGWLAGDLHPQGACGNAAAATAAKGEQLLDSAARNLARFLADFARFDHRAGGA